ncbi:MAG: hypothetical protein ACJ790_07055 [Myxococcaceae bacterium]
MTGEFETIAAANVPSDRVLAAWHAWLSALATDAEAALAAALSYEALDGEGRTLWLDALDQDVPELEVPKVAGGISRVDLELKMKGAYSPVLDPDDYRCFPIDWPYQDLRYITGFNAVPGNTAIVHHIALYAVGPDNAEQPIQWDAEEPGDGYTCFGGPNGSHPADIPIQLLGFWVPGSNGMDLPEGLGLPVKPGSRLVLQLHYNRGKDQTDQTALQFKVDTEVQRPAYYLPFLKLDWVVGNMKIPAGAKSVQHAWIDDPRNFWSLIAPDAQFPNGFDIYATAFHMHQLGVSGSTSIIRADNTRKKLLDIPDWDFHWQREYRLSEPVVFNADDKLELRCNFDNSPEHQPYINGVQKIPADVNWGEGTGDEMCESTLLISPR